MADRQRGLAGSPWRPAGGARSRGSSTAHRWGPGLRDDRGVRPQADPLAPGQDHHVPDVSQLCSSVGFSMVRSVVGAFRSTWVPGPLIWSVIRRCIGRSCSWLRIVGIGEPLDGRRQPLGEGVLGLPRRRLPDGRAVGHQPGHLGPLGTERSSSTRISTSAPISSAMSSTVSATEISVPDPALKVLPTTSSDRRLEHGLERPGGVEDEVEVTGRRHRAERDLPPAGGQLGDHRRDDRPGRLAGTVGVERAGG